MRNIKEQLGTAVAIGVAGGVADFAATSGWMHRSLTHKSYEPKPVIKTAARTVIWGTGVVPRVWAAVHRKHHSNADVEGDPHSPVLQGKYGVLKVMARNPFLYRDAAKKISAEEIPADLQPDRMDKLIFDKSKLGLLSSVIGHTALNKAAGNPAYMGVVSFGVEMGVYVAGGNLVNAIGHAGKHPAKALVTGEIEPNEDGSYGADSVIVGTLTLGEGMQRYHHDHPESPFFGPSHELNWGQRIVRDPVGAAALVMIDTGLAERGVDTVA